jgi:dTDP-4-dehydrorhamnose reductase
MSGWLVIGASGMLGRELVTALRQDHERVVGLTHRELDITDEAAVHTAVRSSHPDNVVNCAAWTAVDDAETHEDAALLVNGHGARYLAEASADRGARLVQLSTDYVFDGDIRRPYAENDAPAPGTAYGRTKLAGERAVLQQLPCTGYVVRTAWLYGAYGPNFVRSMINLESERAIVHVVDDQRGQPTWTVDVVGQIRALVRAQAPAGIYHATSSGETTWFGLAQEVFQLLGADPDRVKPTTSSHYRRPAARPACSVLGHDAWARAGIAPIRDWRLSLRAALPAIQAS